MSEDPFDPAFAFVERPDNDGQPCHVTPNDPGKATAWGVTFATWSAWQRMHGATPTLAAFQALTMADTSPLYRALFWNACQCGSLAPGVGLMVFDAAVGSAPLHAARWLQSVVGVPQDGAIGPQTIAAAGRMPAARIINALATTRESFYASLPTFRYFGNGWDRRAEDCRRLALSMVAKSSVAPSQSDSNEPTSGADSTDSTADTLNAGELSQVEKQET